VLERGGLEGIFFAGQEVGCFNLPRGVVEPLERRFPMAGVVGLNFWEDRMYSPITPKGPRNKMPADQSGIGF